MQLIGQEACFQAGEKAKSLPEFVWDWQWQWAGQGEVYNCMWFLELFLTDSLWESESFVPFVSVNVISRNALTSSGSGGQLLFVVILICNRAPDTLWLRDCGKHLSIISFTDSFLSLWDEGRWSFIIGNLVEETRSGSINSLLVSWAGNGHIWWSLMLAIRSSKSTEAWRGSGHPVLFISQGKKHSCLVTPGA